MSMQSLMQQAQKIQRELQKAQTELAKKAFNGTNGGAVTVTLLGSREVTKVEIDEDMLTKDDKEMLQEMVKNAVNDALLKISKAEAEINERITGRSGGLGL